MIQKGSRAFSTWSRFNKSVLPEAFLAGPRRRSQIALGSHFRQWSVLRPGQDRTYRMRRVGAFKRR